jgi:methionyl-tRNA formyltransferase
VRAIVFAYHDVGVRCLAALLARDVEVALVLTHLDSPTETIWFDSVAATAVRYGIPTITPTDPNSPDVLARIAQLEPDFLFSFYYRSMLGGELLKIPRRGALNMHGSLLPKYRGRVPINWAIIHGETETGATLHYMREKPDAGPIVDHQAVPILPDDTALDVFRKVTCAAEIVMHRSLPALAAGNAPAREQNLASGSYFSGRKPQDGIVDWRQPAKRIHDLVRAVAPPYPGAWTTLSNVRVKINRTRWRPDITANARPGELTSRGDRLFATCGDGACVEIHDAEVSDRRGNCVPDLLARVGRESLTFG